MNCVVVVEKLVLEVLLLALDVVWAYCSCKEDTRASNCAASSVLAIVAACVLSIEKLFDAATHDDAAKPDSATGFVTQEGIAIPISVAFVFDVELQPVIKAARVDKVIN